MATIKPPGWIDPVQFELRIRSSIPEGMTMDPWERNPDSLYVMTHVRFRGCEVPVRMTFFDLKTKTPSQQAVYLKTVVEEAVAAARKKAEEQCKI
jgi:hypothetical protein